MSRAYTCWHPFMGGTLTASFHHEPRRVPAGRWVAQRVRRLASVWLGSNIQCSLEVTRVRSELGCHSHRFSRRPRPVEQSTGALPPNALLLSAVHPVTPYTHTVRQGHAPLAAGWCARSPTIKLHWTYLSQLLQRARRETSHTRRCWCRRARARAKEALPAVVLMRGGRRCTWSVDAASGLSARVLEKTRDGMARAP